MTDEHAPHRTSSTRRWPVVAGIAGIAVLASALATSLALGVGPRSGTVREDGPLDTGTSENVNTPDSCHRGVSVRVGVECVEDRLRGGVEWVGGGVLVAGDADGDLLDRA